MLFWNGFKCLFDLELALWSACPVPFWTRSAPNTKVAFTGREREVATSCSENFKLRDLHKEAKATETRFPNSALHPAHPALMSKDLISPGSCLSPPVSRSYRTVLTWRSLSKWRYFKLCFPSAQECDILLSIVGLLYTKYVGSKNRTEGWCRKMAFKQPPRVKLFWTKMVGVWTWCSWKRQVQKGTLQSGLPIFQMLYYCNAAIWCVHVISSARWSLRSQILFIIRIQKSAWLIAKFKHDSVRHMNECTNKSQDVVF